MAEKMDDGSNVPNEAIIRVYSGPREAGAWSSPVCSTFSRDAFHVILIGIAGNIHVDPAYLNTKGDLSVDTSRLADPAYTK